MHVKKWQHFFVTPKRLGSTRSSCLHRQVPTPPLCGALPTPFISAWEHWWILWNTSFWITLMPLVFVVYWEFIEWMVMCTQYWGRTFILYFFFRLKLYLEPEEIHNADDVTPNLHALLVGSWSPPLPVLYIKDCKNIEDLSRVMQLGIVGSESL